MVSVTPNAGGPGGEGTFSFLFSDPDGSSNLAWVEVGLDSTTDGVAGCYVKYDRAPNTISIFNDSGSAWSAPIVLGVPGTLSNSQCQVDAGASSFSTSTNNLTVNLALAFTTGFTGSQNIYMEARDMAGMDTGLLERGIYQVNACTGAYFIRGHNVIRVAGNVVWAFGQSYLPENDPKLYYWAPRVTSTEFLNGQGIIGQTNVQMNALPGGIATNSWHNVPSVLGVGTYRMDNTHAFFSICGTSNASNSTNSLFVQRPTISGNNAFWYLGGAPSIDGYYTQTTLTASPNGAPEAPFWSATQNPSKISLTCSVCTVNTITSQAASAPGQSDVKVKVSVGGLESEEFGLAINAPDLLVYPDLVATGPHPLGPGYETLIEYKIRDLWSNLLFPITLHETFENWQPDWPTALVGWPGSVPKLWTASQWLLDGSEWFFADTLYAYDTSGTWVPQPRTFFGGLDKVTHATQKFFVGSGTPFNGKCVQRARAQYYTDHGEPEGRASPVPANDCQPGSVLP